MPIELTKENFDLVDRVLIPKAQDLSDIRDNESSRAIVSEIVERDDQVPDLMHEWRWRFPLRVDSLNLPDRQLRHLQTSRLFLRNRRIVAGYEIVDERLREKIGAGCPPTWLTIGKWTARTIGDLLKKRVPVHPDAGLAPKTAAGLVGRLPNRMVVTMGRVFVLGNREIFAQVAGAISAFNDIEDFESNPAETFEAFIGRYGERLLGEGLPGLSDELTFAITSTARYPLSDSMLRALYCYYRAIGTQSEKSLRSWVLAGNLHLAAYEQMVAQTFLNLALAARPGRRLAQLLADAPTRDLNSPRLTLLEAGVRPRDMLLEDGLIERVFDQLLAAITTRLILAIAAGTDCSAGAQQQSSCLVLSPSRPLPMIGKDPVGDLLVQDRARLASLNNEAAEHLERVWVALDRAQAVPKKTRVRDWRSFDPRLNYIANLFGVSLIDDNELIFSQPVLEPEQEDAYLAGRLSVEHGAPLDDRALEIAKVALA